MIIGDLMYQASAGKRMRVKRELAQQWAVGLCAVTTAASLGVLTGILIAPKSGKETRVDLKKMAEKPVEAIEKAILEKAGDK